MISREARRYAQMGVACMFPDGGLRRSTRTGAGARAGAGAERGHDRTSRSVVRPARAGRRGHRASGRGVRLHRGSRLDRSGRRVPAVQRHPRQPHRQVGSRTARSATSWRPSTRASTRRDVWSDRTASPSIRDGDIVFTEHFNGRLSRIAADGTRSVVVDSYEGGRFEQPQRSRLPLERLVVLHGSGLRAAEPGGAGAGRQRESTG